MTTKASQLVSYLYNKGNISFNKISAALPDRRLTYPFEIVTTTQLVEGAVVESMCETVLFNQG